MTDLISDGGVCRTALATLGLLITGLKCEYYSKHSFPKKKYRVYKRPLASIRLFSKLCKKSVETKLTRHYFRVFMRKCISRIWVFLALRPCRKRPPVWDKIQKYLS